MCPESVPVCKRPRPSSLSVFMICLLAGLVLLPSLAAAQEKGAPYEATYSSLDAHAAPTWFHDAKLGIFIHWGVYAVPAWAPPAEYAEW